MAAHTGTFPEIVNEVIANWLDTSLDTVVEYAPTDYFAGTHVESALPTWPSKNHSGSLDGKSRSMAQIILEDKLYVFPAPATFDDGLIAEEKTHNVRFWNAGRSVRTIQSVTGAETAGTSIDHPTLPQAINPESETTHTVTVNQSGPATQYTTYTYLLDSTKTVVVLLTGQRIRIFAYNPDWTNGIKHKYQFQTVLSRSDRFNEQRRPLFESPRLTQEASFWFDDLRLQKLINDLRLFKGSVVGVPVYSEPLTPVTSPLLSESTIEFSEDFSDYWHLNEGASMVVFFDTESPEVAEIKEIQAIDGPNRQITFANSIFNDFDADTVIAYPVMISASPVPKIGNRTDRLGAVNLVFEEVEQ